MLSNYLVNEEELLSYIDSLNMDQYPYALSCDIAGVLKVSDCINRTNSAFNYYVKNIKYAFGKEFYEGNIPLTSHQIWLTDDNVIQEISDKDIDNLLKKISILDSSETKWKHILWIKDINNIPKTVEILSKFNIDIKSIYEIKDQLISYDIIEECMNYKKWGTAVDLLRENILSIYGGLYTDLNFIMSESPERYMKRLDFFNMNNENYLIASSPGHPNINKALDFSMRLINYHSNNFTDFYTRYSDRYIVNKYVFEPFSYIANTQINQNTVDFGFDDLIFSTNISTELLNKIEDISPNMIEDSTINLIYVIESFGDLSYNIGTIGYDDKETSYSWNKDQI